MSSDTICIAAALIVRDDGSTLLVRKRGTTAFMQPGGKIGPGEAPAAALARELREELGCEIANSHSLGRFSAPAAHEAGRTIEAELYQVEVTGEVAAAAEIEELVWIDPHAPGTLPLAPLTRDQVLPLVRTLRRNT